MAREHPYALNPDDYFDYLMANETFSKSALFFDSPKGRTLFAFAAGYVLRRWTEDCSPEERDQTIEEFREFTANYMARSRPSPPG